VEGRRLFKFTDAGATAFALVMLCVGTYTEGVWKPSQPRSKFWRRRRDGGQGLMKRIRCHVCRQRIRATLHTRIEDEAGQLVAFLFEMPEH
jgi:hypothetical protein